MNDRRLLLALLLACGAARARADVVTLRNGVKLEGILAQGEDDATTLRVSADGYVVLDTATVVDVQRQTAKENARLQAGWAAQDRQAAEKERDDKKFAETQRAKGLIPYQGEWITPAEFDRRLALDKLDVERYRAAHPAVPPAAVEAGEPPPSYLYTYTSLYYRAPRRRKLDYSESRDLPRINGFSSSGNFIRRSEFYRPDPHPGAHYFDPSTGLYR
jgi:hypothetical protein